MTNAELIKALRYCATTSNLIGKCECPFVRYGHKCIDTMLLNAADALEAADKRIAELEAQLPKEGEWKWLSSTYDRVPREMRYWCSVCHHEEITHNDKPWKHYCPNCGARMRGEQE
jgi:hypothetical protein